VVLNLASKANPIANLLLTLFRNFHIQFSRHKIQQHVYFNQQT